MRVRSLFPGAHFLPDGICEVETQRYVGNRKIYIINGLEYSAWLFKVINDLPNGWKYCECGSATINDMCCECGK
jgi:hypothetical protein